MRRALRWLGSHPPFSSPHAAVVIVVLVAGASVLSGQQYYRAPSGAGSPVYSGGAIGTPVLAPDGVVGAPAYSFSNETTMGFWRTGAGSLRLTGAAGATYFTANATAFTANSLVSSVDVLLSAAGFLHWTGRGGLDSSANGIVRLQLESGAIGSVLKADALPVASACGGGVPAAVAGSTPLSGAVTVGTGGPTTCTITFGGTAYPNAPHCSGAVETTTPANTRTMGYSSSTTVLTIVPSAAWADSSVVNWNCMSPK